MPTRALLWFKRDLRLHDHAALLAASRCDAMAAVYVVEPEWIASPEIDAQHLAFARANVLRLAADLRQLGLKLLIRVGEPTQVFEGLQRELQFTHLFSHEETGPLWTYARDRRVAQWCRSHAIAWQELPQTGVIRRLRSRDGWAARWEARMREPQAKAPERLNMLHDAHWLAQGCFPSPESLGLGSPRPLPPAGEAEAHATLAHFLEHRSRHYRVTLSSPQLAELGCSRLSAHLAFGTLSLRQVAQASAARIALLQAEGTEAARSHAYHLRGFASRLRWHCHFMQKLEDQPELELHNLARSADGLRESEFDRARFEAWCEGRTGYPMVDACMRQLRATGWLNFRMRAMLVSFAAYHLWLHWREPGLFLARQFLDFEPGIHWSQMQMQSGTTGINTLRIYSPAKQAADHDPDGRYQRRWIPELGSAAYPRPIVDERAALALARQRLGAWRGSPVAREEADVIQARHGSRRSGLPPQHRPTGRRLRSDPSQQGLFEGVA